MMARRRKPMATPAPSSAPPPAPSGPRCTSASHMPPTTRVSSSAEAGALTKPVMPHTRRSLRHRHLGTAGFMHGFDAVQSYPVAPQRRFLLVFDKGDDVLATLRAFAESQAIRGASFVALGARGGRDGSTLGGPLIAATVFPTLEMAVVAYDEAIVRETDEATGLALITRVGDR